MQEILKNNENALDTMYMIMPESMSLNKACNFHLIQSFIYKIKTRHDVRMSILI